MEFVAKGFTLIDGTGSAPVADAALHVKDGRIAWVGASADLPTDARQAPVKDFSGKFVIPGIIDAHIHVCWNGRESIFDLLNRDRDLIVLEAVQTVRNVLATGTTTVRDIGGQDYIEMSLRSAIDAGHIQGPRMRVSGKVIAMTGGHGHFIAREADGPDELRRAAREQIKRGADNIKLMATGGAATPGQDVHASQLTVEEMAAAVDAAHAMGRTASSHCHGTGGIKNSILAGMDSIEHGTYLDDETADMMAEGGTALVFTLGVAKPDPDKIPPAARAEAERLMPIFEKVTERTNKSIRIARERGVLIGSGTDAGGNPLAPHDFSMAKELEAFVAAGVPEMDALMYATKNNAQILRWQDDIGTLESGKFADFVVLAANPLDNISNVRRVEAVFKGGEQV